VHEQVSLSFAATAQLLEGYSGGSDGRSLRTIVANLAPRALVLIGGSQIETQEMASACKRELPQQQTRVYTPGMLQIWLIQIFLCALLFDFPCCVAMYWICEVHTGGALLYNIPAVALPAGRQGSGHAPHSKTFLEHLDALLTGHVQCVVCAPDITLASVACTTLCQLCRPYASTFVLPAATLIVSLWLLQDQHTVCNEPAISWVTNGGCSRRLECPSCT
jgi:predicted nucleic acid-binding Zn ribbon protein